jgi:hypothetical protein
VRVVLKKLLITNVLHGRESALTIERVHGELQDSLSVLYPCCDRGTMPWCAIRSLCLLHLLLTVARLAGPVGARAVVAE